MQLEVTVHAVGEHWRGGATMRIQDPLAEAFEPLRATDDECLSIIFNEAVPGSVAFERVVKLRKNAAKYLADHLADMLVKEMTKNDTLNGYAP